jgi:1-deoxy-D-xylulose-5-phosphate reductoisomerase
VRDVIILGSTGSIGTQALDIVRDNPDRFRVVGLGAGRNRELAEAQAAEFGVTNVAFGADDAVALIESTRADVVLNGITGAVGLAPTLAALATGATLALANKESLIIGGALVKDAANPGQLVPVDSEHSALAQALMAGTHAEVAKLVVTASGGPADREHAQLELARRAWRDAQRGLEQHAVVAALEQRVGVARVQHAHRGVRARAAGRRRRRNRRCR